MGHLVLPLQADEGGVSSPHLQQVYVPLPGAGTEVAFGIFLAEGAENPITVHGFEMLCGWKHLLSRKATSGAK